MTAAMSLRHACVFAHMSVGSSGVCVLVHGCLCGSVCACSEATARFVYKSVWECVSCFAHSGGNQAQFWTLGRRWSRPNLWNEGKTPSGWEGGDVAVEVNSMQLEPGGGKSSLGQAQVLWGGDDLKGHVGTCGDCRAGASGVFHRL